jgi:DNA primase
LREDLERLKHRLPLLEYLQRHNWTAHPAGTAQEFFGLCPLHEEGRPSFYVNARKNLFYCHGCGRGGDLIRFIELFRNLSFRQSVVHLREEVTPASDFQVLGQALAFYQLQLHRFPEAAQYLEQRGLRDPRCVEELEIGYAPGGNLRRYLGSFDCSCERLFELGLLNNRGSDTFYRRVVFPCRQEGQIVNIYGRSIGTAFPHRLLPRSKGGLVAWDQVSHLSSVILVEGFFDLAVLRQAGFRNTTCSIGTQLTPSQFHQLSAQRDREIYIVFDQDKNQAGQRAARQLAQRLARTGVTARVVQLPAGHDPNSYFVAGATAADFTECLRRAQAL